MGGIKMAIGLIMINLGAITYANTMNILGFLIMFLGDLIGSYLLTQGYNE